MSSDIADLAELNIFPDVNVDGVVDIRDLVMAASELGTAAAPADLKKKSIKSGLTTENLEYWIQLAKQISIQGSHVQEGISVLEHLLDTIATAETLPITTALLDNYPNPFNPETWIPYQLAKPAKVNIFIYSADGKLVRSFELGYLTEGIYHSKSRAVHWDGRNIFGETAASGIYFYTLIADGFTSTRKLLIRK